MIEAGFLKYLINTPDSSQRSWQRRVSCWEQIWFANEKQFHLDLCHHWQGWLGESTEMYVGNQLENEFQSIYYERLASALENALL